MEAARRAAEQPAGAQARANALGQTVRDKQRVIAQTAQFANTLVPVNPSGYIPARAGVRDAAPTQLNLDLAAINESQRFLFPFSKPDPQDPRYTIRQQLVGPDGQIPGVGQAFATEEYFDYIQRKYDQYLQDDLKSFIFQQIDLSTPQGRQWWETHFPEYTKELQTAWEMELDYNKRLGLMQVNGVQSMEDMWILFCRQKGLDKFATRYLGIPPTANTLENKEERFGVLNIRPSSQMNVPLGFTNETGSITNQQPTADDINNMYLFYKLTS